MTKMDIFPNSLPPDLEQPLTVLRDRLREGQRPLADWSGEKWRFQQFQGRENSIVYR